MVTNPAQSAERPFVLETGVGHVNRELGVIIAPSCAGINFMIALFLATIAGLSAVGQTLILP
ncbi:MAG: hypothetical protein MJE77_40565 [Proteobacteria bacterium]|nr:hypothetical protein [Pseudomonadota bacterium]